jgi:hypothetical protein
MQQNYGRAGTGFKVMNLLAVNLDLLMCWGGGLGYDGQCQYEN